jgi:hypothetical protein
MKLKLAIVFIVALGLIGCGGINTQVIQYNQTNAQNTRTWACDFLSTWPMNFNAIKYGLGTNYLTLPKTAIDAMEALNTIAAKIKMTPNPTPGGLPSYDVSAITDADVGQTVGEVGQLILPIVSSVINQYAPNVTKYIPALLKF